MLFTFNRKKLAHALCIMSASLHRHRENREKEDSNKNNKNKNKNRNKRGEILLLRSLRVAYLTRTMAPWEDFNATFSFKKDYCYEPNVVDLLTSSRRTLNNALFVDRLLKILGIEAGISRCSFTAAGGGADADSNCRQFKFPRHILPEQTKRSAASTSRSSPRARRTTSNSLSYTTCCETAGVQAVVMVARSSSSDAICQRDTGCLSTASGISIGSSLGCVLTLHLQEELQLTFVDVYLF